jgi:hypothetical protein
VTACAFATRSSSSDSVVRTASLHPMHEAWHHSMPHSMQSLNEEQASAMIKRE